MGIKKVTPMIQRISDKLPKIEEKLTKSSIKYFETFRLFVIGCIFAFLQCCNPKSSIGRDLGQKTQKSLFSNCIFCPNLFFLAQHCFSLTLKQL